MAKLYGNIASSALMTFDKSFARANGQPLDSTEVYYSLAAAQEYAAGAGAYVGQKIVVIEEGVVTHYSIEDAAGTLKELGSKPVGDESSIVVAENGTISLKGVGALVFERDILGEDGEPTGEKEEVQYQPLMTAAGLIWVEPSKTTVEGLATLIDALTIRVKAAEDAIDAIEADYLKAADKTELSDAIGAEAETARAAEEALGKRIDAIDEAVKAIDFVDEDELAKAISDARTLISKEIDDDVAVAQKKADDAYALAETKLDANEYAADKIVLNTAIESAQSTADEALNTINAFLTSEDVDETVNTLKEIKDELDKLGEAVKLEEQFAAKADKTYVDEELAKKQDVIAANTYDVYGSAATAKSEAIADAEGKIAEAVSDLNDAIDAVKGELTDDIATAKSEAIADAATAAAGIYATKTALSDLETALDARLDVLEAYEHDTYATKAELQAHDEAAAAAYATKDELKATDDVAKDAQDRVGTVETKVQELLDAKVEENVIEIVKVNGEALTPDENKAVDVIVPTKFSDIADDSGFSARIDAALKAGTDAQTTANTAVSDAAKAQKEVDDLEVVVGELTTVVAGHTTSIGDHTTRIAALEQADIAHATEYNTLSGIVSGHTAAIATKAEQTTVDGVIASAAANTSAIKTINETTIPAINAEIAKKANAADVYTKTEINAITGTVAEGKTIVKMIEDAQSAATYDDAEVRGLISDNAAAIKAIYNKEGETAATGILVTEIARVEGLVSAEAERAAGVEAGFESRIATMETFWEAADDPEGTIDKLAEIVNYIAADKSGALDMAADIKENADAIAALTKSLETEITRVEGKADANTTAIAAINNETTGILAVAKKYADDKVAAIPAATAEALGLVKFDDTSIKMNDSKQLYVAEVSTDKLVQGLEELVLNGGTAKE